MIKKQIPENRFSGCEPHEDNGYFSACHVPALHRGAHCLYRPPLHTLSAFALTAICEEAATANDLNLSSEQERLPTNRSRKTCINNTITNPTADGFEINQDITDCGPIRKNETK